METSGTYNMLARKKEMHTKFCSENQNGIYLGVDL
jgi:hypothetical protein